MAVYVDEMTDWGWRLGPSCHMIADSDEELHLFAERIGLRRRWVQTHRRFGLHYDLTASRRARAVEAGAVEVSARDLVRTLRARKAEGGAG